MIAELLVLNALCRVIFECSLKQEANLLQIYASGCF